MADFSRFLETGQADPVYFHEGEYDLAKDILFEDTAKQTFAMTLGVRGKPR